MTGGATGAILQKRRSRNFHKNHRKTPVSESLFSYSCRLRPATLVKKRLWHSCFPVNFVKFVRTPFLQNTFERLSLKWISLEKSKKILFPIWRKQSKTFVTPHLENDVINKEPIRTIINKELCHKEFYQWSSFFSYGF